MIILFVSADQSFVQENTLNVVLNQPLPQHFQAGEFFFLQGKVENFQPGLILGISASNGLHKHVVNYNKPLDSDSFVVPVHLQFTGIYHLSMNLSRIINNRDSTIYSKGPFELFVSQPQRILPQEVLPISDFAVHIDNRDVMLTWDSGNELFELQYQQSDLLKRLVLSNNPNSVLTTLFDLADFSSGNMVFQIRGARSNDGTLLRKSSEWSSWQRIEYPIVQKHAFKIDGKNVDFLRPLQTRGRVGDNVPFKMDIKTYFDLWAYVKRPDNSVDIIDLKTKSKKEIFTTGTCYKPGKAEFSFIPDQPGVYIVEINNHDGIALVKVPFYCGEILPILPAPSALTNPAPIDSFHTFVLKEMNRIRENLSIPLLHYSDRLEHIAEYYTNVMKSSGQCSHGALGQTTQDRIKMSGIDGPVSENIACADTLHKTFLNLLNSPSHYSAMIDKQMNFTAIAWKMDSDSTFYVAQYFSANE